MMDDIFWFILWVDIHVDKLFVNGGSAFSFVCLVIRSVISCILAVFNEIYWHEDDD